MESDDARVFDEAMLAFAREVISAPGVCFSTSDECFLGAVSQGTYVYNVYEGRSLEALRAAEVIIVHRIMLTAQALGGEAAMKLHFSALPRAGEGQTVTSVTLLKVLSMYNNNNEDEEENPQKPAIIFDGWSVLHAYEAFKGKGGCTPHVLDKIASEILKAMRVVVASSLFSGALLQDAPSFASRIHLCLDERTDYNFNRRNNIYRNRVPPREHHHNHHTAAAQSRSQLRFALEHCGPETIGVLVRSPSAKLFDSEWSSAMTTLVRDCTPHVVFTFAKNYAERHGGSQGRLANARVNTALGGTALHLACQRYGARAADVLYEMVGWLMVLGCDARSTDDRGLIPERLLSAMQVPSAERQKNRAWIVKTIVLLNNNKAATAATTTTTRSSRLQAAAAADDDDEDSDDDSDDDDEEEEEDSDNDDDEMEEEDDDDN
jgi:hypothetical protein